MSSAEAVPVDLSCLARFTGGDAALDAEILNLFAGQTAELIVQLQSAAASGDGPVWRRITHSLKGAARGIGASALAHAAAEAEPLDMVAQPVQVGAAVKLLKAHAEAINRFVAMHLAATAA